MRIKKAHKKVRSQGIPMSLCAMEQRLPMFMSFDITTVEKWERVTCLICLKMKGKYGRA
jgi:hypothetical protein